MKNLHPFSYMNKSLKQLLKLIRNVTDDAVSASTARLVATVGTVPSNEVLAQKSTPAEAIAAVHHFASSIEKQHVSVDLDPTFLTCVVACVSSTARGFPSSCIFK